MRAVALLAVFALTACLPVGSVDPIIAKDVQQCNAESGFTARAAAAHASGVQGDIPATPKEMAAINACLKARAPEMRSVRGIPQTMETQVRGGTGTKTYTYGAPPATAAGKPAASTIPTGHRACRNTMVGGDGYACMPI